MSKKEMWQRYLASSFAVPLTLAIAIGIGMFVGRRRHIEGKRARSTEACEVLHGGTAVPTKASLLFICELPSGKRIEIK